MIIILLLRIVCSDSSLSSSSRFFSTGCTDSPTTDCSIGMFTRWGSNAPCVQHSDSQVHHEWTAPIALATDYCHPVEHALVNVLPNIAYAILIGSDPFSYLFW